MSTIATKRKMLKFTHQEMAEAIDVTVQTYARLEKNPDMFRVGQLKILAQILGLNVAEAVDTTAVVTEPGLDRREIRILTKLVAHALEENLLHSNHFLSGFDFVDAVDICTKIAIKMKWSEADFRNGAAMAVLAPVFANNMKTAETQGISWRQEHLKACTLK